MEGCCPSGSIGAAASPSTRQHRGDMVELSSGMWCYVVQPGKATSAMVDTDVKEEEEANSTASSSRALLVGHDVFGLDSGRTRLICDELADDLGVLVIAPDFLHLMDEEGSHAAAATHKVDTASGTRLKPWEVVWLTLSRPWLLFSVRKLFSSVAKRKWPRVKADYHNVVLPFLQEKGVRRLAALGFCWGGWFVVHASGEEQQVNDELNLCCGVSMHPSLILEKASGNLETLCDAVNCPQMILAASNDPDYLKEGGTVSNVLSTKPFGSECVFEAFPDMYHGWVNRGDMTDPVTAENVTRALSLAKEFLRVHLLEQQPAKASMPKSRL